MQTTPAPALEGNCHAVHIPNHSENPEPLKTCIRVLTSLPRISSMSVRNIFIPSCVCSWFYQSWYLNQILHGVHPASAELLQYSPRVDIPYLNTVSCSLAPLISI